MQRIELYLSVLSAVLALLVTAGCTARPDAALFDSRAREAFRPVLQSARAAPASEPSLPSRQDLFERADLTSYLQFGLHSNAALRASFERWRAAIERVPQATALPDPRFSFSQFVESIETRTGPQERRYSLSQTFPWFGKLGTQGDVAQAAADVEWQKVVLKQLEVERDIAVAFYDYAYLAESTRITESVLGLLRQLEPSVRQRIVGATGGQEDLLRLQVEIGKIENDLRSLERVRRSISARLAAAMNVKGTGVLPLPKLTAPKPVGDLPGADQLLTQALATNPELRGIADEVRRGEEERRLAEYQRWPDFTVGVDYFETGSAIVPTPDDGTDPLALTLSFNLPIWSGKYGAAEREAEARISSATHRLADRQATLRADIEHAAFELDDAGRQIRLYADSLLPRAREALDIARSSYRAGRSSLLDVIDSERALLEFETAYWRACRDQMQSQARLEALVGGPVR